VRIITPGTLTDTAYLEGAATNFLSGSPPVAMRPWLVGDGRVLGRREMPPRGDGSARRSLVRRPAEITSCRSPRAPPRLLARLRRAAKGDPAFADPQGFAPPGGVRSRAHRVAGRAASPVGLAPRRTLRHQRATVGRRASPLTANA
jgi:hypothetical protein